MAVKSSNLQGSNLNALTWNTLCGNGHGHIQCKQHSIVRKKQIQMNSSDVYKGNIPHEILKLGTAVLLVDF